MPIVLLAVLMMVSGSAFGSETCPQSYVPNLKKSESEKIYPVQVLKEHGNGSEAMELDHEGPGYCFGAEKGYASTEIGAFEYERLGLGRGEAYDSFLVKRGEKHALVIGFMHLPQTEAQCSAAVNRYRGIANARLANASENFYDNDKGVYVLRPSNSELPAEEREIRLINGGKDLTLHFVKDLNQHHIICIFPRR